MKKFVDALLVELSSRVSSFSPNLSDHHSTLYFGGGTPSMLSTGHLKRLIEGIYDLLPKTIFKEFSFEANPATFTEKKVNTWAELGITRVSLGIQSWDVDILHRLGREHTPAQAEQSCKLLKKAGIPEVNIDLMFSIPGQSPDIWKSTLEKTLELSPEHISTYNLTYEEDTAFYRSLQQGHFSADNDQDADLFEYTHQILTSNGYRHYETSNYCRDNKISHHNMGYWMGRDYIGIGPSAVSTINGKRIHNTPDTNNYIASTLSRGTPDSTTEYLSAEDVYLERLALMLRTDQGIPLSYLHDEAQPRIEFLMQEKLVTINQNNHLVIDGKGRLLVDEIVMDLIK